MPKRPQSPGRKRQLVREAERAQVRALDVLERLEGLRAAALAAQDTLLGLRRTAGELSDADRRALAGPHAASRQAEAEAQARRLAERVSYLETHRPTHVRVIAAAREAARTAVERVGAMRAVDLIPDARREAEALRAAAREGEDTARAAVQDATTARTRALDAVLPVAELDALGLARSGRGRDEVAPALDAEPIAGTTTGNRRALTAGYAEDIVRDHLASRAISAERAGATTPDETSVRQVSFTWDVPVALSPGDVQAMREALASIAPDRLSVNLALGAGRQGGPLVRLEVSPAYGAAWSPADLAIAMRTAIGPMAELLDRMLREYAGHEAWLLEYWVGEEIDDWPDYEAWYG